MFPSKPKGTPSNKNRNRGSHSFQKPFKEGGSSRDASSSSSRGSFTGKAQNNRPNKYGYAHKTATSQEHHNNPQWNRSVPAPLTIPPPYYQPPDVNMYRPYTPQGIWYPNQPRNHQNLNYNRLDWSSPRGTYQHVKTPPKLSNVGRSDHLNELPICPGCSSKFNCMLQLGTYIGKVPLLLNCKHTVCQECINQTIKDDSVICPVCKNPSTILTHSVDNVQEVFPPNFYVLGVIFWDKYHISSQDPVTLVAVENETSNGVNLETQEICCYVLCNRVATLRCKDCCDVYCSNCCTTIHKSAKSLASHTLMPISKEDISIELEICTEHDMEAEFFCETCNMPTCCYCFIENHEGHVKQHLAKLSATETTMLQKYKENAQVILRRLLVAKKKINDLENYTTSTVVNKLSAYFVNLYGRLQIIESNLHKELNSLKQLDKSVMGLNLITPKVNDSIRIIKEVLVTYNNSLDKKINMKAFLKQFEEIQNFPCFLVNEKEDDLDPIDLIVNPILNNLEGYFSIKLCQDNKYNLVTENELSPNYLKDSLDSISDDEISLVQSTGNRSTKKSLKKNERQATKGNSDLLNREMVRVTHIESLECFYVQMKKFQNRLNQMNDDIHDFIKLASMVENPQINNLYLALYTARNKEYWCRGRLTEIKNGEKEPLYDIFFIDYGSSQTLDISKLREITPHLAQKKPFAIQCELYNPTFVNWSKNAHVYMGKIINGKDVYMLVKQVHNGVHQVDLMVLSADRNLTSIVDLMVHTCKTALNASTSDSSVDSSMNVTPYQFPYDHKIYSNSVEFKKNQEEQVIIANVVDPHHIFIHIAAHAASLKKLLNSMKIYYRCNRTPVTPTEGNFVIVYHKDKIRGNWHRALVKKTQVENETATVYCIDWGLNLIVPWKKVRMLTEQFTKLESQAILVKLAHIEPFNKTGTWSAAANNHLEQKYLLQEVLKMVVINVEPLEVGLFVMLPKFDMCLNTKLVMENLADSVGKISQTLEWPSTSVEENDSIPSNFKKLDQKVIDESEMEEQDKALQKERAEVIKVIDPGALYVKFLRHQDEAEKLYRELNAHYSKERTTKESWDVGELCVVCHGDAYVRGLITTKLQENRYKVNMYDIGQEDTFTAKYLYIFHDYFRNVGSVAFKCHLADIRPAGGDNWSKASIEVLENIFESHNHIYFTKAASEDTSMPMESMPAKMWYTEVHIGGALEASTIKYVSINKMLVNLGYAYKLRQGPTNETNSEVNSEVEDNSVPKNWEEILAKEEQTNEEKKQDSPYHTHEIDIQDWKPAFPINESKFKAVITCATIKGIIFLREDSYNSAYKSLEQFIKEYFVTEPPQIDKEHVWQPGQICTIEYKGGWYRGKVCGVTHPENDIQVVMIDFGSEHDVSRNSLYRQILYPTIPAFASKIKLDGIHPKSGKWLSSDHDTLLDILTPRATVLITGMSEDGIPLAQVYTDGGLNVNEEMMKRCPNLISLNDSESSKSDDDAVVIEEEEDLSHMIPGTHVDTTDFAYNEEPIDEDELKMFVMSTLSYNEIVLHRSGELADRKLDELLKEINRCAEFQPGIEDIRIGISCISRFSDNMYYRARVYSITALAHKYLSVYFVDFGNVHIVSIDHVKMMKPSWFRIPLKCHLAHLNFELSLDIHSELVFEHIRKLFGKTKTIKVIKRNPFTVDVYNNDGQLFYHSLIEDKVIIPLED